MLRKDVAEAAGITDKTPLAERAKALKGKTIGIQGVGSIVHAWQRLVAHRGGLDVEKDVRIAPMDPPAMLPALENKAIDGYATSMPFTTQAVVKGSAVMLASGGERCARSAAVRLRPGLHASPRPAATSARSARAWRARSPAPPGSSARSRTRRWSSCASASTSWIRRCSPPPGRSCRRRTRRTSRVTVAGLENSQKVSLEAKLLAEKDALKSFDGLYTDEFLR